MKKRIHLICNAHLDPVWQWEWEEGAAEAISTFRVAARFCEEHGDLVFNHNEALLYRWIEEYEPALFEKIVRLVKEGKWNIIGGWHLQPDCNMVSGEGFVRQALVGRNYFDKKFGVRPTTAINFDSFGHSRGLVQILKKSGYDSYIITRPAQEFLPLESNLFTWVGYDGSEISVVREKKYNSKLGKAVIKIKEIIEECPENDFTVCLWGIGNHGGGPSKIDLDAIDELTAELAPAGIEIVHSSPEKYFAEVSASGKALPRVERDLNPWAVGCYTSQIRLKQKYRLLENTFYTTEKMCVAAELNAGMKYPREEFDEVLYDMLTAQFHDFLPGSSIQAAEESALRTIDHGLEILSRVKARAFFALAGGQPVAKSDEIPILIYNPHPFAIEDDFECEMMLWDQNWELNFSMPKVYDASGNPLNTQCEKENSNLHLDWRKRVVFHAKLEPMKMNRFNCKYTIIPEKPVPTLASDDTHFIFESKDMQVKISKETGLMDKYAVNGVDYIKPHAFAINVINDSPDAWGMLVTSFRDKIGEFKLLSEEEGSAFSGVKSFIPSVRIIENGDVRTVVEAVFGYKHSRAVIQYKLSKTSPDVKVDVRLQWAEIQKMAKLSVPTAIINPYCIGQTAYGEENMPVDGSENVSQKYIVVKNDNMALSAINSGIYGSSMENGTLMLTLLRSPAYTGHPIEDREMLVQDRFTPHIDQGERFYNFEISAGNTAVIENVTPNKADAFNEKPMALSFFPCGDGSPLKTSLKISTDNVQMPVFKKAENGNGYIVRLFNPSNKKSSATLSSELLPINDIFELNPFEILTIRITENGIVKCNLIEE